MQQQRPPRHGVGRESSSHVCHTNCVRARSANSASAFGDFVLGTVEACGKGAQTGSGQASPRRAKRRLPRLAPLYVTADAVRLCIYSTPPPNFGVLISKILTATYFYENFVPLCCLNAWQTCCAPRPSIP